MAEDDQNKGSENKDGDNAPDPDLTKQVADLQKKLSDQNESAKRMSESKSATEQSLAETQAKVKDLETKLEDPKEDSQRIAELEVNLARSKAVSKYGLTEDDADRLKGTPAEILSDAEYWADRRKDDKTADQSNRDMIDAEAKKKAEDEAARKKADEDPARKTSDSVTAGDNKRAEGSVHTKPKPSENGNSSWLQRYEAANPRERYKMDQDVQAGLVDPTK